MAGKYLCVNLHLIWSTKERRRFIHSEWENRLHAFLGSISSANNAKLIEVNSQPDHIHLYISLPSTISLADLINAYKSNSSRWIRQTFTNMNLFSWQEGYAAFSVSKSREKATIEYIRNQQNHHKHKDFNQEILEIFNLHEITYDPRYLLK
jgi:putative transposase